MGIFNETNLYLLAAVLMLAFIAAGCSPVRDTIRDVIADYDLVPVPAPIGQ